MSLLTEVSFSYLCGPCKHRIGSLGLRQRCLCWTTSDIDATSRRNPKMFGQCCSTEKTIFCNESLLALGCEVADVIADVQFQEICLQWRNQWLRVLILTEVPPKSTSHDKVWCCLQELSLWGNPRANLRITVGRKDSRTWSLASMSQWIVHFCWCRYQLFQVRHRHWDREVMDSWYLSQSHTTPLVHFQSQSRCQHTPSKTSTSCRCDQTWIGLRISHPPTQSALALTVDPLRPLVGFDHTAWPSMGLRYWRRWRKALHQEVLWGGELLLWLEIWMSVTKKSWLQGKLEEGEVAPP